MDRNNPLKTLVILPKKSLSARRAWIEIAPGRRISGRALRSLSARRAWIEITLTVRNVPIDSRRSPQGERG